MNKTKINLITSALVFIACMSFGIVQSAHKETWGDEVYSQQKSVNNLTYLEMIQGKIPEGNNSPLFYMIQKVIIDTSIFETPKDHRQGHIFQKQKVRVLLRFGSVIFMSLSAALVFYYFSNLSSLWLGILSLFIFFSSYMTWVFFVEARHYALWFCLTTIQSLLFLNIWESKTLSQRHLYQLASIHLLLSLTVILSMAQIFVISGLVLFLSKYQWKKQIFLTLIPLAISMFYYLNAPKFSFQFVNLTPEQLIRDCFSRDRFYILSIFLFFFAIYCVQMKTGLPKLFKDKAILKGGPYFIFTVAMICSAILIIALFKHYDHGEGFAISSRYFIFLTPISIISTTLIIYVMIKSLSPVKWIQWPVLFGMGHLIYFRFIKTIPHIESICKGIFNP